MIQNMTVISLVLVGGGGSVDGAQSCVSSEGKCR